MDKFLGHLKPNVNRTQKQFNSSFPFPIPFVEDIIKHSNNQSHNWTNKWPLYQVILLESGKGLVTNQEQIECLQMRGCYGYFPNQDFNHFSKDSKVELSSENQSNDSDDSCSFRQVVNADDDNSDNDGVNLISVNDSKQKNIGLILNDVEILFLSHGLGCIKVYLSNENSSQQTELQLNTPISMPELWYRLCTGNLKDCFTSLELCRNNLENFIDNELNLLCRYASYVYYRSHGWIVRPGLAVGGADYLLYAEGPNYRHASFCVLIHRESLEEKNNKYTINCAQMATHVRVTHSVGKLTILCRVKLPDLMIKYTDQPWQSIREAIVTETLIDFWKPNAS